MGVNRYKGTCSSNAALVNKYVGTAYDHVKTVSDNIEDVKTVAGALGDNFPDEGLDALVNNIDDIVINAENISDINTVAGVKDEVVTVAGIEQEIIDVPSYTAQAIDAANAAEEDADRAETEADRATEQADLAANIADPYKGLWPDVGGSANKGDVYQTQLSGTPTGQYFTALQGTTIDPTDDSINWREVVSGSSVGLQQVTSTGSTTPRSLNNRFSDVVNVKDFGAVGDGVTDDYQSFQDAVDYMKSNEIRGKLYAPDTGYIYRFSQTLQIDVDKITVEFDGRIGPFGSFAGYLVELSTDRTGNPFFDGADWLWPKTMHAKMELDGRSPDGSVKQSLGLKVNRLSHSKIELLASYCDGQGIWITDTIESDFHLALRLCGKDTSSYVTNNGAEYCCIRDNTGTAATEPGVGASWGEQWVPTGLVDSGRGSQWIAGTGYQDGRGGAALKIHDDTTVWDGNNNLRFWGADIAYPAGAIMDLSTLDKAYGTRNIFFYGAQLHHQDEDITGSEGAGQPNYPGPNHSPAAAALVYQGVAIMFEWCENVQFKGGNIRKGLTAAGTLCRFGDANVLRPVKNIVFDGIRFSGEGDNLNGFHFIAVQLDDAERGIGFVNCDINVDGGTDSQVFKGDLQKLSFNTIGVERQYVTGSSTDSAFDMYKFGDAFATFTRRNDGRLGWGPGNAGIDTTWERSSVGNLINTSGAAGGETGLVIGTTGYSTDTTPGAIVGNYPVLGAGGGVRGYVAVYAGFTPNPQVPD